MVNRLEIPRLIDCFVLFCFCYYMIELLRFFQNISCVFSSEHENQNVAPIGTLLDHVLYRDKTRSLGNKML